MVNETLSGGGSHGLPLSVSSHTTSDGRGPSTGLTRPVCLARCPITVGSIAGCWRVGLAEAPAPALEGASAARLTFVTADVRCLVQ